MTCRHHSSIHYSCLTILFIHHFSSHFSPFTFDDYPHFHHFSNTGLLQTAMQLLRRAFVGFCKRAVNVRQAFGAFAQVAGNTFVQHKEQEQRLLWYRLLVQQHGFYAYSFCGNKVRLLRAFRALLTGTRLLHGANGRFCRTFAPGVQTNYNCRFTWRNAFRRAVHGTMSVRRTIR